MTIMISLIARISTITFVQTVIVNLFDIVSIPSLPLIPIKSIKVPLIIQFVNILFSNSLSLCLLLCLSQFDFSKVDAELARKRL